MCVTSINCSFLWRSRDAALQSNHLRFHLRANARLGLAGLGIVWHQYWTTNKLRDRPIKVEQRLPRIEGFLGISMPPHRSLKGTRSGPRLQAA